MKILLNSIAPRAGTGPTQTLLIDYTRRLAAYIPTEVKLYRTEQAFLDSLSRHRARTPPVLVLLDSRGTQFSSEALAAWIAARKVDDRQLVIFAIGPADGWSAFAREQASLLLSLGSMTLPHELARVVLAEQLYRACTILAGHPYHASHARS